MKHLAFILLALCVGGASAQDLALSPANSSNFRFKDVLGQVFSSAYISNYSYGNASVTVTIDSTDDNFLSGKVVGTGLKPNFAYQIKLSGRPLKMATTPQEIAGADDATNERLGKIGRWWRQQPNPANSNDGDYEVNKNDPAYIYQGYLIIGFFVTDAAGAINTTFTGNNSYHVLWRVDQRTQSTNDGPGLAVTLPDTGGNTAYDVSVSARNATLYGEWEPTRAIPGKLNMPQGDYKTYLVLTEESFHDFSANAGNWTAAMSAEFNFSIPTSASPGSGGTGGGGSSDQPLSIDNIRAALNSVRSNMDYATVQGTLDLDAATALTNQEVRVNFLGVTRTFTLDKRGRGEAGDARAWLRRNRKNPSSVEFRVDIRHASLVVLNAPTSGIADVSTAARVTLAGATYAGSAQARYSGGDRRATLMFSKR